MKFISCALEKRRQFVFISMCNTIIVARKKGIPTYGEASLAQKRVVQDAIG